jgi:small nuclear ribonucleoprotein (snRNP)-like protein
MNRLEELDLIAEQMLEKEIAEHLRRGTDYPKWLSDSLKRIEAEDNKVGFKKIDNGGNKMKYLDKFVGKEVVVALMNEPDREFNGVLIDYDTEENDAILIVDCKTKIARVRFSEIQEICLDS